MTGRHVIGAMVALLAGGEGPINHTDDASFLPIADEDDACRREVAVDVISIELGMATIVLKRRR